MNPIVWPLGVYFLLVMALAAAMLSLSYLLGQRHRETDTDLPFEGGVASTGSARIRFSAKFYLIAMLFVIFDLESVFIFAWAVAGRQLGWPGYIEMIVFVGILVIALIYLWSVGALDWAPPAEKRWLKNKFI
ncbi:MAG TPA: NADH-quinone oxidoreductase subunit A [Candidatus Acidoferrum sp.]|nr:NADH-quinone oxidoreductase subunit A [Candidatus Acidoferrum sp.]